VRGREAPALMRPNRSAISLRQDDSCSFDHLVGAGEKHWRHGKAECTRGLRVDDELELGRLLDRKIGGLLTLEDAIDVAGRAPVLVNFIRSVGDQAAIGDVKANGVDRCQLVLGRERND
jgi:hypothetical protein